jgi:long-subunit acyl-CoA synthetase (AMP-forming)
MSSPRSAAHVAASALALQRLYHWEATAPDRVVLTQPLGGGAVRDYTWAQAMDETRRMAAHLSGLGFEPGSRIAILSKNCAHGLMCDFAIWIAGFVSVPLYPTLAAGTIRQILAHSEARLLFVGKLDGWDAMKGGVPPGLPCIGTPLSPPNDFTRWDDVIQATAPLPGQPVRAGDELATIMYTSGTTGNPKGVMHSFATFAWSVYGALKRVPLAGTGRIGLPIIKVYGMTENCGVSHATLPGVQRPGTVGKAYDGVQSRLDPATGEIQIQQGQRAPRPARAARLPGRPEGGLDRGQRLHHADLQGQAQPHRGGLRSRLRALGRRAPARDLAVRVAHTAFSGIFRQCAPLRSGAGHGDETIGGSPEYRSTPA